VGTFVKKALGVVGEIRSRGKLPILVGGTHYYTQSLLFQDGLGDTHEDQREFVQNTGEAWPILKEPTSLILDELRRVDPVMADRWHPNDRRKIQRSLEIYLQTGKKASDIYAEQRKLKGAHFNGDTPEADSFLFSGPSMRFPTLLFWVHADQDTLKGRLDKRVDKMIEHGLLGEVQTLSGFARTQTEAGKPVDETRGIWVSIGYKEFKAYSHALQMGNRDEKALEDLKAEALQKTKVATRQYAKRQLRWIRIKLVNALARADAGSNLYLLDGSNISDFEKDVVGTALELTGSFLTASNPMPEPSSLSTVAGEMLAPRRDYDLANTPDKWTRQYCELCGVTCVTEEQWSMHIKSKAHKKLVSKRKKAQTGDGERPGVSYIAETAGDMESKSR
jgi:tRNA dimethylallyltransferase